MKKIKFRAWTGCDMKIVKQLDYEVSFGSMTAEGWIVPKFIMQYTGLKDKNGKEIYEGDIVNGEDGFGRSFIGAITYEAGVYYIRGIDQNRPIKIYHICEIIGNIYENPELLEDGADQ